MKLILVKVLDGLKPASICKRTTLLKFDVIVKNGVDMGQTPNHLVKAVPHQLHVKENFVNAKSNSSYRDLLICQTLLRYGELSLLNKI